MSNRRVTYVEIDLDYCAETYGTSPCTASIPTTGADRCYNTRCITADCQDPANFNSSTKTVRYSIDTGFNSRSIDATPSLVSASITPAVLKPAKSIGERTTASLKFKNHPSSDTELDKYYDLRSYDPFKQGTYWGKFIARNSYLEGREIRIIQGHADQPLSEMTTYHYVIDSVSGPDSNGFVTIKCVDVLRFLDGKEAQAPEISAGRLSADITDTATSATLEPAGIGNADYPASGTALLGDEIVAFTRSGDVLTLTRAQEGTEAEEHEEDEIVQICLEYSSENAATIVEDLITEYTAIDETQWIDSDAWQDEILAFNSGVLYSNIIARPTPVKDLIDQLCVQVGLVIYPDIKKQKINFEVLRPVPLTAEGITDDVIINKGVSSHLMVGDRVSQSWTHFNKKNKAEDAKEAKNYRSGVATVQPQNLYEKESIRKTFADWIPAGALSVATTLNNRILARYSHPPRKFTFSVPLACAFEYGQGVNFASRINENADGSLATIGCRIVSISEGSTSKKITLEEIEFNEDLLQDDRIIIIDNDAFNINLRTLHDEIYSSVGASETIEFIVTGGTIVGSNSTDEHALKTGTWPVGQTPLLTNNGYIVGRGGDGVMGGGAWGDGEDGGPALDVEDTFDIDNTNGVIGGGGGAGAGYASLTSGNTAAGGAGAGAVAGLGSQHKTNGIYSPAVSATLTDGGPDYSDPAISMAGAGEGGDLGQNGSVKSIGYTSGLAGNAVDGDSNATWVALGTIHGTRAG